MLTQALNNTADDGAEESVKKESILKTGLRVFTGTNGYMLMFRMD